MEIVEDKRFTAEYLEADKRSIANAIQVFFKTAAVQKKSLVEYPVGIDAAA